MHRSIGLLGLRKSSERGHANHGWLDTYHTFSFADYYDPNHMSFRALRVLNEDRVAPKKGFPQHSHRDMEILTYVLEGALQHKDSLGNGSIIRPGDIQCMSAGTGIQHSEFNASETEGVHLLQIWIEPDQQGGTPGYEQQHIPFSEMLGKCRLIASPQPSAEGRVQIHADARVSVAVLEPGQTMAYDIEPNRFAWVHLARGHLRLPGGETMDAGDAMSAQGNMAMEAGDQRTELLIFDLA